MFARSTLFLTALAAFATPALAGTSINVSHADLNLATEAGARQLERRIEAAANRVCGVTRQQDLKAMMNARACKRAALAGALPKLQVAVAEARTTQQLATATAGAAGVGGR
jgi:UrcA family protein